MSASRLKTDASARELLHDAMPMMVLLALTQRG